MIPAATDCTMQDKVTTASSVIKNMQVTAARRSAQAKKVRQEKKQESRWQIIYKQVDHPIEIVEDSNLDSEENSDLLEQTCFSDQTLIAEASPVANVKIRLQIKGRTYVATADIGA